MTARPDATTTGSHRTRVPVRDSSMSPFSTTVSSSSKASTCSGRRIDLPHTTQIRGVQQALFRTLPFGLAALAARDGHAHFAQCRSIAGVQFESVPVTGVQSLIRQYSAAVDDFEVVLADEEAANLDIQCRLASGVDDQKEGGGLRVTVAPPWISIDFSTQ